VLDSVVDRYAEGALIVGLVWAYRDSFVAVLALLALTGSFLVPYVRAPGEAAGAVFRNVGLMQRPERIVLLGTTVALAPAIEVLFPTPADWPRHALAVAGLAVLALSSQYTAVERLRFVLGTLPGPAGDGERSTTRSLVGRALVGLGEVSLEAVSADAPHAQVAARGERPRLHGVARAAELLSTVGGLGRARYAPGTLGALPAVPLGWALAPLPVAVRIGVAVVLSVASIPVVERYVRAQQLLDPQEVVLDEFVGCLLCLVVVPFEPLWVLAALGLFRMLDIVKPWPIRWVERRVHGGAGVVLEDVAAGVIGAAILVGARALLARP